MQPPTSAVPNFYYVIFALYEPALTITGLILTLHDPARIHNSLAPWPAGITPPAALSKASVVTTVQYSHVCALLGVINFFVLTTARRHLTTYPTLHEKIARSILIPLLIGDCIHLYVTLWALGNDLWDVTQWSSMALVAVILDMSFIIPRAMWCLGIWRYVNTRDQTPVHTQGPQSGQKRIESFNVHKL